MRTITRLATIAAISSTVIVGAPLAAQADTPGCVTQAEFQHIHRGMSKTQVRRSFDTDGHREFVSTTGGMRDEYRTYRVCPGWGSPRWSDVSINFDNDRTRGSGMRVFTKSSLIMH